MITVQEGLRRCNLDTLLALYCRDGLPSGCKTEFRAVCHLACMEKYLQALRRAKPVSLDRDYCMVTCAYPTEEGERLQSLSGELDSFCGTYPHFNLSWNQLIQYKEQDLRVLRRALWTDRLRANRPRVFAYQGNRAEEMLGAYLPDCLIDAFSLERNLALIIRQLTFFGFPCELSFWERCRLRFGKRRKVYGRMLSQKSVPVPEEDGALHILGQERKNMIYEILQYQTQLRIYDAIAAEYGQMKKKKEEKTVC